MSVRRPRTAARASLALLASVALSLGGCGQDAPEPKVADPTPVSQTPSETASTTTDGETPEAFIQRWMNASTDMQNSGDATEYRSITRSCDPCSKLADKIEAYYAAGGYVQFGGTEVLQTRELADLVFKVVVKDKPTKYKSSADAAVANFAGGRNSYEVTLTRDADGYLLDDFWVLPQ
ncbi:hypothetical protein [Nocardioides campestrisoli]|uniref:hypothetical protein n=1 Tax=Nocardioides campestrisoli TaxID=2736757 RepID=UPI0015E7DBEA|nr:hypothetical protein [Nocardioides campestrisoli]